MDEDKINLLDLWQILMRRKLVILIIAGLAFVAGLAYALLAPPVYKAEAVLLPPSDKYVQALNVQALNMQGYTSETLYDLLIQNLNSRAQQRHYFDTHKLADSLAPNRDPGSSVEQIFKDGFSKPLSVNRDKKDKSFLRISFEGADARLAATWVNGFIAQVNAATVNVIIQEVENKLDISKHGLREEISAKRNTAGHIRNDRIAELEEAIYVAERLGIKEDAMLSQMTEKSTVALNQMDMPLYMRGTRALQAEAESLRARKDDDPFIYNLRSLQEKLALLEGIRFDPSSIAAMQVDREALVPGHRIKPKRKQIVLLALFIGLVLGVGVAFFIESLAKARREKQGIAVSA